MALLDGEWTAVGTLLSIGFVSGLLSLLSAIAWFVWFDRVVRNVAPLTGKWPEVSRPMAVIWWLVPVVGQFKGTFVVGHIYGLMAVAGSPGLWLLGLWGITWIGGTIAPGIVNFAVGWLPFPLEESIRLQDLVSNLGQISYIAAGFFAAALILAFEHARDVRMAGEAEDMPPPELEVSLVDRLVGRQPPGPTTSWTSPQPGATPWPAPPEASTTTWPPSPSGDTWPSTPDDAPTWPGAPTGAPDAGRPAWMAPPTPGGAHALTGVKPITAADPFQPPAAAAAPAATPEQRAKVRAPVPWEPILLMGALVLAGVVAGITMAGMADPFGELGQLTGRGPAATGTPRPTWPPRTNASPGASLLPSSTDDPVTGPATPPTAATPTPRAVAPTPTPERSATPVPPDTVARRVARLATDDGYRGLTDIEGTDTDDDSSWTVELGTSGDREWRLQRVARPDGDRATLERVILSASVWERGERDDWDGRSRNDQDRTMRPLFDLSDAAQLDYLGMSDVDGVPVYRFGWGAGDTRIIRLLGELGRPTGRLRLASGELLATAEGLPVRLEVRLVGNGDRTVNLRVDYSKVGAEIEVRSPRIGRPLVVRS
jgi:hypothetical protein